MPKIKAKEKEEVLKTLFENSQISKDCRELEIAKDHNFVSDLKYGNYNSDIMFVGEAPGKEEDEKGIPFVGRAGEFFNESLKEIGFERKDVWVSNVVKYRPTETEKRNRRPYRYEISSCKKILIKEINIINPRIIVTLGLTAIDSLLDKEFKLKDIHGKQYKYSGKIVIPTYHPAAAMRFEKIKKRFKKDFKKLKTFL